MISGTIIGKRRAGTQVFLQYSLTDGTDGEFGVSIGAAVSDITTILQGIVDSANYAESLMPLVGAKVYSSTTLPNPVKSTPQVVADASTVGIGKSVVIPVSLINSAKLIVGVQVDVVLLPGFTLSKAALGQSAIDAQKSLSQNAARLLVSGVNQIGISDGPILLLTIAVDPSVVAGSYVLAFTNGAATDAIGNSVVATYPSTTIKVG